MKNQFIEKEWFILIDHLQMGPYSLLDLKLNRSFTPDTLVWKKGFPEWIKARFVPELKYLFGDEPESSHSDEEDNHGKCKLKKLKGEQDVEVLMLQQDPYQFLLWILLVLLLIIYALHQFYRHI